MIIDTSDDSCDEDTSLEKDYIDEPMSSSGSITSPISSNTNVSHNTSKLSNITPSNKECSAFHMEYVYPQRIPLKETQANLELTENFFHTSKTTYLQTSRNGMQNRPTPTSP